MAAMTDPSDPSERPGDPPDRDPPSAPEPEPEPDRLDARLRTLVETLPAIVYIDEANERASTIYISPQVQAILGLQPADWIADDDLWARHVHPDDLERAHGALSNVRSTGRDVTEYRMLTTDGRTVWIRDEMILVTSSDGAPAAVHGVMFDVTQRVALEERLRQAETLEAVGRLAGGVAHDFNNYLTAILGNVSLVLDRLPSSDPLTGPLREAHDAAQRAGQLTRQLLTFGRRGPIEPRPEDLGALTARVTPMLRRAIGEDVELDVDITPDLPVAMLDGAQIEQLLVNLALNARDAMPAGGRIRIVVERLQGSSRGPGRVGLSIEDDGVGMDADTLARAFEPFYTTKGVGHGIGFGLAAAYGIVTAAGGEISVQSEPGRGTAVRIAFPGVDAGDDPHPGGGAAARRAAPPGATILVVEDEEALRSMIQSVLERAGYRVLTTASGDAAIDLARDADPPVDLLITDMVMPNMNGAETAALVRAMVPGLPVLFMSGYPDRALRDVDPGAFDFIGKPFLPDQLLRRVASMLAAAGRNATSGSGRR